MRRLSLLVLAATWFACSGPSDSDTAKPDTTPPAQDTDPADTDDADLTGDTADTDVEPAPPPPETCDAGDVAWVGRVMPLVWGRRPHGAYETQVWAAVATQHGREQAVRAMMSQPEAVDWWALWLTDTLGVARVGDKAYNACYGSTDLASHDGSLATFMANNLALNTDFGPAFSMADVLRSAVIADDLSVAWRGHLYARMNRPVQGANVSAEELEYNRRVNFGETFFEGYLGRNLTCLPCHNSLYSVTDDPDPALDRTWQLPGLFELALWNSHTGVAPDDAYAMFRHNELMDDGDKRPWGWDDDCGELQGPSEMAPDAFGANPFFLTDLGDGASVWNVEQALFNGVGKLAGKGLTVAKDGTVDGEESFAYLVANNIVDSVWEEAAGAGLTIAFDFARNEAQASRLQALTDAFVYDGFSLTTLVVAIAADPYLNPALDTSCGAGDYTMQPLFSPWSTEETDVARQGNGVGDRVHRQTARVLVRSAHDALGWPAPTSFLLTDDQEALYSAIGAYLRESQPGFNGSDFQGLLAWESTYGDCSLPPEDLECASPSGGPGCGGCECEACVIALDPYCGNTQWDGVCEDLCFDDCGGCTDPVDEDDADVIALLFATANDLGLTVGDVLAALKDRVLLDSTFDKAEQDLIEQTIGASFTDSATDLPKSVIEASRQVCGVWLRTPQSMLATEVTVGPVPAMAPTGGADCQRAVDGLASVSIATDCETLEAAFLP